MRYDGYGDAARSWSCWAAGTRHMRQPCGSRRRTIHSTFAAGLVSPSRWLTGLWQVCQKRRCPWCPLMITISSLHCCMQKDPKKSQEFVLHPDLLETLHTIRLFLGIMPQICLHT